VNNSKWLLSLHAAVLTTEKEHARARYEAYGKVSHPGNGRCNGCRPECKGDLCGVLCDKEDAAEQASHAARDALVTAIKGAAWGSQPDGSFVTRSSNLDIHITSVHAPNKRGVIALLKQWRDGSASLETYTHAEAWVKRLKEKEALRQLEEARQTNRKEVIKALLDGRRLEYVYGQEGGSIRIPGGTWASFRGVLRGAELTEDDLGRHGKGDHAWVWRLASVVRGRDPQPWISE
jgi:hypothetical protein